MFIHPLLLKLHTGSQCNAHVAGKKSVFCRCWLKKLMQKDQILANTTERGEPDANTHMIKSRNGLKISQISRFGLHIQIC